GCGGYERFSSPVHRHGPQPGATDLAAGERPVRCVVFHSASAKKIETAFSSWMEGMLARYHLVGRDSHKVPLSTNHDDLYDFYTQCYDVYRFVPKATAPAPAGRIAGGNPRPTEPYCEVREARNEPDPDCDSTFLRRARWIYTSCWNTSCTRNPTWDS